LAEFDDDSESRKPHVTGASPDGARSVSCSEICLPSGAETIAATWYRPDALAAAVPCVVMGHGFTLTRRDGLPGYAQRLAAAGFAALAFDYRHWGDSTGNPRGWISLREQLADWQAAVQHARTLQGVDAGRIAVWGFSMGGGHALLTAARDNRIAAAVALMLNADPLAALPPLTVTEAARARPAVRSPRCALAPLCARRQRRNS
jgi:dipeptidyl aminopeptidase/acylaminoacyl peptidase